jgi:hypothetical protein
LRDTKQFEEDKDMGRWWNEIKYTLVLNILFPSFCLFVGLPCLILIMIPAPAGIVLVLSPRYVEIVVIGCLLLFGLDVAANLGISRYLRLHQTESSPYTYEAQWDWGRRSSYFRIYIKDKTAFRSLKRRLKQEHRGKAIWFWLWLDDLPMALPLLLIGLFAFVFMFLPWLAKFLWKQHKDHKPFDLVSLLSAAVPDRSVALPQDNTLP